MSESLAQEMPPRLGIAPFHAVYDVSAPGLRKPMTSFDLASWVRDMADL